MSNILTEYFKENIYREWYYWSKNKDLGINEPVYCVGRKSFP